MTYINAPVRFTERTLASPTAKSELTLVPSACWTFPNGVEGVGLGLGVGLLFVVGAVAASLLLPLDPQPARRRIIASAERERNIAGVSHGAALRALFQSAPRHMWKWWF
jgi:hypothetical protein